MGAPVRTNQILLEWDPYTFSILTEVSGTVHFKDLQEGISMQEQVDEVTGMSQLVVVDSSDEKRQPMVVVRPESWIWPWRGEKIPSLPTHGLT